MDWDDREIVFGNPWVRDFDLRPIWTDLRLQGYFPLVLTSFSLDHALFGWRPGWFHLVNVAIHWVNVFLVCRLLVQLGVGRRWKVAAVAALFAVHPLQVEPVAWVTGRKDLLCAAFYLAALLSYLRFALRREAGREGCGAPYALALGCLALALASKAMAVTLPATLVWIDLRLRRRLAPRLILEKLPFLGLAAASAVIEWKAQLAARVIEQSLQGWSWGDALRRAAFSLGFYLSKWLAPTGLSVFYEPGQDIVSAAGWAGGIGLLLFLLAGARSSSEAGRSTRFGLCWFVATLAPVLKAVPFGAGSLVNDRYMYLPSIGLGWAAIEAASLLLPSLGTVSGAARKRAWALPAAFVAGQAILAGQRVSVWRDSGTLWSDALRSHPGSIRARQNLGLHYLSHGQGAEAVALLQAAWDLGAQSVSDLNNLALAYGAAGRWERALPLQSRLLELSPGDAAAWVVLGQMQWGGGLRSEAKRSFEKALQLDPGSERARSALEGIRRNETGGPRAAKGI